MNRTRFNLSNKPQLEWDFAAYFVDENNVDLIRQYIEKYNNSQQLSVINHGLTGLMNLLEKKLKQIMKRHLSSTSVKLN